MAVSDILHQSEDDQHDFELSEEEKLYLERLEEVYFIYANNKAEMKILLQRQIENIRKYILNSPRGDTRYHVNSFLSKVRVINFLPTYNYLPILTNSICSPKSDSGLSGASITLSSTSTLFGFKKQKNLLFRDVHSLEECSNEIRFGTFRIETIFTSINQLREDKRTNIGADASFVVGGYGDLFKHRDIIPMPSLDGFGYKKFNKTFYLISLDPNEIQEYKVPVFEWLMSQDITPSKNPTFMLNA